MLHILDLAPSSASSRIELKLETCEELAKMFDDEDPDTDLNLLQELLETEKVLETESPSTTSTNLRPDQDLKVEGNGGSFSSFLENLDNLPVTQARKPIKLADITSRQNQKSVEPTVSKSGTVHNGDTDSSDDEDNRHLDKRYNECGAELNNLLRSHEESKKDALSLCDGKKPVSSSNTITWKSAVSTSDTLCLPATKKKQASIDVYTEPMIGIRIINPLVSSSLLKERLNGRRVVPMSQLKNFVNDGKHTEDWVLCGVIVSKTPPRTSAKGSMFSIIRLSDLRGPGDIKTASLFLFSRAFKNHGKDTVGTVLGILNPGVLDNSRNHGDEACLSVDNPDRIMVLGISKDFGTCKSKKKNGENCTAIVNTANCEYCVYHVKQEYQKCSRRSDIQSSFNGQGLVNLRNKILGKNEVFYGGQSFSAIPAKKSKKLTESDSRRLMILSGQLPSTSPSSCTKPPGKSRIASSVELSHRQVQKDSDRLRKLIQSNNKESSSQSVDSVPQYNPDEVKPNVARSAALALVAKKKELVSKGEDSERTASPSESVCLITDNKDPLHDGSSMMRDAAVMKESVPVSRGIAATLGLNKKDENTSKYMPSALGLGRKTSGTLSPNMLPSLKEKSNSIKPEQVKISSFMEGIREESVTAVEARNVARLKSGVSSKVENKISSSLDSKKLYKLSSNGLDLESRLLKQAAQKAAEQESTSKLGPNATASMMGLGRTSLRRGRPLPSDEKLVLLSKGLPVLGAGLSSSSVVDLDAPINKRLSEAAKLNAINLIRRSGGIKKGDPNVREFESRKKATKTGGEENSTKRRISEIVDGQHCGSAKRAKLLAQKEEEAHEAKMARFKELMEATSKHTDLVEAADDEAKDEYFGKLEKKEQLEEKMLSTFKVACKAVRCLTCKYTSFSAAELCKTERHPLKVMDATKRFWKCGDCGNRTVSLELIPLISCKNCGGSRWERAAMIRERKVGLGEETLSIRGLEEKFIGAVTTGGNVNLLVPEDGM